MAPLITHLVIGERVFAASGGFELADYGPFLLGCVLVDVHVFSDVDRRATHLAERLSNDGPLAFHRSCANFLAQLDTLLLRPWDRLTRTERAFVAGFLCHLAADEDWKQFDWDTLCSRGIYLWRDIPVPGDVILTAFDVLSSRLHVDFPAVVAALEAVTLPDVFTHLPGRLLRSVWDVARAHALDGRSVESYMGMLQRMGKSDAQVAAARHAHELHWDAAIVSLQDDFGGVEARVQAMARRALGTLGDNRDWLWS